MEPYEDRIRTLPCWNGRIEIAPLGGGLSNSNFLVTDGGGRYVVRLGRDYPFHHVFREREAMAAQAAHEAGFGPSVRYVEPGAMVCGFIEGRTFDAADVRANAYRIVPLIEAFHRKIPAHVPGATFLFRVFHVIRDYARLLEVGGSRMAGELPRYLALSAELEAAQIPMPTVFGHNDLLPANFIDDGEKIWLIDYEYAGFNTALFDLAGIASNSEMDEAEAHGLLAAYFGHEPDAALHHAFAAMRCASLLREAMWSMVSELHLDAPGADYAAYTAENLARLDRALDRYKTIYGTKTS